MCGIYGIVSDLLTKKHEDIFKELMVVSSLRGAHSTGVAAIAKEITNGNHLHHRLRARSVGNPFNLLDSKRFDIVMNRTQKLVLMGHGRFATRGAVTEPNAHPFMTENIIGCHNGTIQNGLHREFYYGTDSEAALNMFDEFGVENTIPKLQGAWAFTWHDLRNKSFNVLRNAERPLYFTINKAKDTIFYASEAEFLELVLTRNNVETEDIYWFKKDVLYSWDLTVGRDWIQSEEQKEIKGKEAPVYLGAPFPSGVRNTKETPKQEETKVTSPTQGSLTVIRQSNGEVIFKKDTASTKTKETPSDTGTKGGKVIHLRMFRERVEKDIKRGYGNSILSDQLYDETLDRGCCWCGDAIMRNDKFIWLNHQDIVCESCVENPLTGAALEEMFPEELGVR